MNKPSRRYLTLLAVLLALPAQAQTPNPAPPKEAPRPADTAKPAPAPASAKSPVDAALEKMRTKMLAGEADKAAYDEFVDAVKSDFESLQQGPLDATAVRARLVAAVDDMYARAKRGKIAAEEFSALRVEVLDGSLLNALSKWAAQPGADGLKSVDGNLKQLVDAAQEIDPGTAAWRGRVQAQLEGLKQKPAVEMGDLALVQEELAHARAMRSEALLEKHATAKGATPTDFARIRHHVSDLLELQAARDPAARDLRTKLLSSIDDLEQRAGMATLAKTDFESLRKELAQRGATAAAPAEKPKPRG